MKFLCEVLVGVVGFIVLAIGIWFFKSAIDAILTSLMANTGIIFVLILGVAFVLGGILILSRLFTGIRKSS